MKESFAIAWTEFDRHDYLVTKSKEFKTEAAMNKFAARLEDKANFNEILCISYALEHI